MSYRQIYYHIIFGTKHRENTISQENEVQLYKYLHGYITNRKCKLYRINGMEDHIHVFSDLHPSLSLADYVKDMKVSSSIWMKEGTLFPKFQGWAEGYAAITHSAGEKDMIIDYIKNQKEHHKTETFLDEYKRLLAENNIEVDERFLL